MEHRAEREWKSMEIFFSLHSIFPPLLQGTASSEGESLEQSTHSGKHAFIFIYLFVFFFNIFLG